MLKTHYPIAKECIKEGKIHIRSSFRHTLVTVTDADGNAIAWASSVGANSRDTNGAKTAAESAACTAVERGMKKVEVIVKGPGQGRESAIRALQSAGLEVTMIKDVTPIPHNGCRPVRHRLIQ